MGHPENVKMGEASALQTPIIVVGGSLVGLSVALFLSHWKVPVILLEKHPSSSAHPCAISFTTRTIELLQSVGTPLSRLEQSKLWADGPPRRVVVESLGGRWQGEQGWAQASSSAGDSDWEESLTQEPSKADLDFKAYSNVEGMSVAQDKIEPLLRERAIELGADLRLGHRVIDFVQDDTGVRVSVVSPKKHRYTLRSHYMIACDGNRSAIREKLGISRRGVGFFRSLRSIVFRCPRLQQFLDHGYSQFQIDNGDFEAFVTTYGDGRWFVAWKDEEPSISTNLSEDFQRDQIRKVAGLDLSDEDITLITTGKWDIGGFIANRFSSGRVLIAGGAAHALPPNRGGYGANTGIADAHNLAWKIAAVVGGKSDPALLETYDVERRAVAEVRHDQIFAREDYRKFVKDRDWPGKGVEVLDDVSMEFGQLYRSGSIMGGKMADGPAAVRPEEWKGEPGIRGPHVALRKDKELISILDLFGHTWVVLSKDLFWKAVAEAVANRYGFDIRFHRIGVDLAEDKAGDFERLYGLDSTGMALIRPDGYIAWRSVSNTSDAHKAFKNAFSQVSYSSKSA
jgi:putative polyketide hydroxylase